MEKEEILQWAKSIKIGPNEYSAGGYIAEIKELIKASNGKNNSFYEQLNQVDYKWQDSEAISYATQILIRFIGFVENNLIDFVSIERRIQNGVVNDFLIQAQNMLNDSKITPAAPAMLIGASLEEFLRNWIEEQKLDYGDKKPSIDSFAKILRENELISVQDIKDITSWAGIRNNAAHGNWEFVNDKRLIFLMFEGVNLFMRKKP
jgi:exoribonuclease II